MVESTGLENRRCESIRGFESHSLRHNLYCMQKYPSGRRGSPAKGVGGQKPREGSNPSFCAKKEDAPSGGVLFFRKRDLKGGSWQQSGGLLQPPWLFRRKANPSFCAKKRQFLKAVAFLFSVRCCSYFKFCYTLFRAVTSPLASPSHLCYNKTKGRKMSHFWKGARL